MSNLKATWVVGQYTGDRAKSVLAHVEHGLGYFLLEDLGTKQNPNIKVAFVYMGEFPLPEHLTEVTDPAKIAKYDGMKAARS